MCVCLCSQRGGLESPGEVTWQISTRQGDHLLESPGLSHLGHLGHLAHDFGDNGMQLRPHWHGCHTIISGTMWHAMHHPCSATPCCADPCHAAPRPWPACVCESPMPHRKAMRRCFVHNHTRMLILKPSRISPTPNKANGSGPWHKGRQIPSSGSTTQPL